MILIVHIGKQGLLKCIDRVNKLNTVRQKKIPLLYRSDIYVLEQWNLHSMIVPATHLPDLALIAGRPCQSTLPSRVNSSASSSLNFPCFNTQSKMAAF